MKYGRVMAIFTSLCEEGRRKDCSLLFQSEAGSSELDVRDEVWDHLNQNLMVSKMVFIVLDSFNSFCVMELRDAWDPVYWIMRCQCLHFIRQLWV